MGGSSIINRIKLSTLGRRMGATRARRRRREHRGRMRDFGVKKKRYLFFIPVLLIMIALAAWGKDPGRAVNRFRPAALTRVNPLMGWAVDAATDPDRVEIDHSLVYARLTWRELEREEGVFDFTGFERRNRLDHWWRAGKRLVLRFVMDAPGRERHRDIPDWLYEAMGEDAGQYYENALGRGFSPNYANWLLIEKHAAVIRALGARYDGHQGVAFVELGSLGHDGGWTTQQVDSDWDMPPSTDLKAWVGAYTGAFARTPLLASAPYQPVRLTGIGLYNDRLGDEKATWDWLDTLEYGGYDEAVGAELRGVGAQRRSAPSGAHIPRSIDQQVLFGRGMGALLRELRESHTTYVGGVKATDLTEAMRDNISVALSAMGYRLWVREAGWPRAMRAGYRLKLDLDVHNDGAQAFSQPWPVELSLFNAGQKVYAQVTELDVRKFVPGVTRAAATIDLPRALSAGRYDLGIAVLDPTSGEPAVELAMNAGRIGLRTLLGEIEVTPP